MSGPQPAPSHHSRSLLRGVATFGSALVKSSRVFERTRTAVPGGGELATWRAGPTTGRPVLFLHGFCGDQSNMRPMALAVAKRRPVIVYDARGHGKSVGFSAPPTMRQLADDLAAVLAQHAPDGAAAVGLSMGAQTIFQHFRARGGEGLHALVFIDQSPKVVSDDTWSHGIFGQLQASELQEVHDNLARSPRQLGRAWLRGMWRSDEHLAIKLLLTPGMATGLRSVPAATLKLAADMLGQDWRAEIPKIRNRTLLLYGGRSIYPGAGKWMAAAMPHAKFEYFDRSGHALIVEEPRRVAATINRFLS